VRPHHEAGVCLSSGAMPGRGPVAILGALPRARAVLFSLVATSSLALSACGMGGLSFVQDTRVDIVHPNDRKTVTLPLTVAWTVKDFAIGDGSGSFGVFVDRSPQPSGRTLSWLFRGDRSCKGTGAALCEKPEFLAQRSVYQTTARSFTVEQVARLAGGSTNRLHEFTIVLLGSDGKRIGEGAWSVQFKVKGEKK
jgi:hypothetical protein